MNDVIAFTVSNLSYSYIYIHIYIWMGLHHVAMGCIANVLEELAAFVFMV
jgi:hypothetical protein